MANDSGSNRPNRPMRPRQGAPGQRRKRRVVIDQSAARPPRDARQQRERTDGQRPKQPREVAPPTGPVTVESGVTVRDLSQALGVQMPELIKILMNLGQMRTATQSLSDDEVELIAAELKREIKIKHVGEEDEEPETFDDPEESLQDRPPVVTIMGHVDHGKTTLLDAIRVRGDLAAEGLQPEEWGGTTQFSDVSAKQGQNLDDLLEKVLLVADAELELTANPNAEASGPIIESRLDVGRGPAATMLVQRGTLRVGDAVVAGDAWGKVRALYNFRGEKVKDARPGEPVEILGFDHPPPAGEHAKVVENERQARHYAQVRGERLRREQLAQRRVGVSLEQLFTQMQEGAVQDLNLVLKGDVVGSVEAAISELQKIQHPEVRVNVIHQGVGGITENDVMLASASNAMVVGFNVRPSAEARALAEREGVEIRTYRVIYQLTEDIEQALVGMLKPVRTDLETPAPAAT